MTTSSTRQFVVQPAPVHQLSIGAAFKSLTDQEQKYAHYMARFAVSLSLPPSPFCHAERDQRAAWHGTRIILRQTAPEALDIYDMILSLYRLCKGDFEQLATKASVSQHEMEAFLDYGACFLSNIGNYYASYSNYLWKIQCFTNQVARAPEIKSSFQTCLQTRYSDSPNSHHFRTSPTIS